MSRAEAQRLWFLVGRAALGWGGGIATVTAPPPVGLCLLAALGLWFACDLYAIWPGPCQYCGRRRRAMPVPLNGASPGAAGRRVRSPWSLAAYRPLPTDTWVCAEHLPAYLEERL